MPDQTPESQLQEALIQIASTGAPPIERIVQLIEQVGGRVLHAYPPSIIVAALPPAQIPSLRATSGIHAIDTDAITNLDPAQAAGPQGPAIAAWNAHVRTRQQQAPAPNPSRGLPWDAPGFLPPDPPPEVREMLRRRERELREGRDAQADEEDSTAP